jgi:hypothetical protein
MKVTMLASISGLRDGVPWPARGGQIELPAGEAEELIAGGLAKKYEKADEEPDAEPEVKGPEIPVPEPIQEQETATTPKPAPAKKTAAKKTAAKKA